MKINSAERNGNVVTVEWIPNWLEKIIGIKPKIKKYADSGYVRTFTGQTV